MKSLDGDKKTRDLVFEYTRDPDLLRQYYRMYEQRFQLIHSAWELRVLTIFEGLIVALFEVQFPFRFPHAVGENGKGKWEPDSQRRVEGRSADNIEIKVGWRAGSPPVRARSDPHRSKRSDAHTRSRCAHGTACAAPRWGADGSRR